MIPTMVARTLPAALILISALAVGCTEDKSFAVVSVLSGSRAIPNVAQLRVTVTNGLYHQELLYPEQPRAATAVMQLDATKPVTFSVSFRPMFKGDVVFEVEALDPTLASLGSGTSAPQPLSVGQITYATVRVAPSCDPMTPATTCGANQTCAVVCDSQSRPQTLCYASGVMRAGESCTDLTDCMPGTECSDFKECSTAAQPVKTCRQFCQSDADCGAGSACNTVISCDTTSTQTRICSRPCNPTSPATEGCASGLFCFIYGNEITDCACRGGGRTGVVGDPCTTDENCQPGLMCVNRGGATGNCQTICQLATPTCPTGTTCTQLTNPVYKVFGACL
jgi:hypothetical protein